MDNDELPQSISSFLEETAKQNNPLELKGTMRTFDVFLLFPGVINPFTGGPMKFPGGCVSDGSIIDVAKECFSAMDRISPRMQLPQTSHIALEDIYTGAKFVVERANNNLIISDKENTISKVIPLT